MIGVVTSELKAAVHLSLLRPAQSSREIEVFIDTGFNGDLSLSPKIIAQHHFELIDEVIVQLADGSNIPVFIYDGKVLWDGQLKHVNVIATRGDAVLGMRLLENPHS